MVFSLVSVSFSFIKLSLITNRFSSVRFPKFVIRLTGVLFATCFANECVVELWLVLWVDLLIKLENVRVTCTFVHISDASGYYT